MSAQDDYKLALNILSRVGLNGDLIGEFGRAKALLHGMTSQSEIQASQVAQPQEEVPPSVTPPMV